MSEDILIIIQQALLDLKIEIIKICERNNLDQVIINEIIEEIDFILPE